jgi:hypothetical protein
LAQFDVLRGVHEPRLVESRLADFVVTRANDYLLPCGLQAVVSAQWFGSEALELTSPLAK